MLQPNLYERLGEADGLRLLVDHFYDHMDALEAAKPIRDMHSADLTEARQKLFEFLSGWSGGPQLYVKKYGHPRLRRRHMHVAIGESEAAQWMMCMSRALEDTVEDPALREALEQTFTKIATHMRNQ